MLDSDPRYPSLKLDTMKRCPTCNRTFTDQNLSFCIEDGTPLTTVSSPTDETVVSPSDNNAQADTSPSYTPRDWTGPAYQAPASHVPPGGAQKRRIWPWVLGIIAALFIGLAALGIIAAIVLPSILRANRNTVTPRNENLNINSESRNTNSDANANSDANSNLGNLNANVSDANENVSPPSTNEEEVLAKLTDLEHEWTAANINADKTALDRILADDYVGTTADGQALGKAEYIRTITRDTATRKWDFEDLKVSVKGNRATLSGIVTFETERGEVRYRFTDKFVWRDGRWQAIGSEISQIT
jgi:Domain of unknown function (DUF4440)